MIHVFGGFWLIIMLRYSVFIHLCHLLHWYCNHFLADYSSWSESQILCTLSFAYHNPMHTQKFNYPSTVINTVIKLDFLHRHNTKSLFIKDGDFNILVASPNFIVLISLPISLSFKTVHYSILQLCRHIDFWTPS